MSSILKPDDDYFDPNNKNLAIILSHLDYKDDPAARRDGNEVDVGKLRLILPKLKCNYAVFNDLEKDVILKSVPDYVKAQNLVEMDSLMIFIFTHGSTENKLKAASENYNLIDFMTKFSPENLKIFEDKPKLFFISACRGIELQPSHHVDKKTGNNIQSDSIPSSPNSDKVAEMYYPNLLIAFGTFEGKLGFRSKLTGTQFIEKLCETFDEFIRNTPKDAELEVMTLLLKTNNKLVRVVEKESRQLAQVHSALTRPYFFRKSYNV